MSHEPVLPPLRAAVFTVVCVGLGIDAHLWMSDAAIPPWALVAGSIGVYATARVGAGRERSLVAIAGTMGVLQVALHLLFSYAQQLAVHSAAMASMPGMRMSGSSMSPMDMPGMQVSGSDMRMSAGMLLAHALAALACSFWLRRGEAVLHTLVRRAASWVVELLVAPLFALRVTASCPRKCRAVPVLPALRSRLLHSTLAIRGPPQAPSFA